MPDMFVVLLFLVVFICSINSGLSQCDGTTLVIELQLFDSVIITSPNFTIGVYPQNMNCTWRIDTSQNSSAVLLILSSSGLYKNTNDVLQLFEGCDDTGLPSLFDSTTKDTEKTRVERTTKDTSIFIKFTSDDDVSNDGEGFELFLMESVDKSGDACSRPEYLPASPIVQFITSPNFPFHYSLSTTCSWNVSTSSDVEEVLVSIIYMQLDPDNDQCYDTVSIGGLPEVCISDTNQTYTLSSPFLVKFISDGYVARTGFVLSIITITKTTTESEASSMSSTFDEISTTPEVPNSTPDTSTILEVNDTSTLSNEITSSSVSRMYESSAILKPNESSTNSATSAVSQQYDTSTISNKKTFPTMSSNAQVISTVSKTFKSSTVSEVYTSTVSETDDTPFTSSKTYDTTSISETYETNDTPTTTSVTYGTTSVSEIYDTSIVSETDDTPTTSGTYDTTSASETSNTSTISETSDTSTVSEINDTPTTTSGTYDMTSVSETYDTISDRDDTTSKITETSSVSKLSDTTAVESTIQTRTEAIAKTTMPEYEALPSAAVGGIITGAIVGVSGLGVLLGVVSFLILKKVGGKLPKLKGKQGETIMMNNWDRSRPTWINMIETMKQGNYNPFRFENDVS